MIRTHRSKEYNWNFDTKSGLFMRWGETPHDDPQCSPRGPEILDMEVSTICHGPGAPCKFCYKSNGTQGKFMSFKMFKRILDTLPNNLTQIAFGIGDIDSNPDLWRIMQTCREKDIIPNITINGFRMKAEDFDNLAKLCGSVAVSCYDKEATYRAVEELSSRGLEQVNIHQILSYDSYKMCMEILEDMVNDPRLDDLNALVFLMLKPKGRAKQSRLPTNQQFDDVVRYALINGLPIGFDSCSAPSFLNTIKDRADKDKLEIMVEPCEAFLFSSYCNVDGEFFPCSFCEGEEEWEKGLNALEVRDFITDIWNHPRMEEWRSKLLGNCRSCPVFNLCL